MNQDIFSSVRKERLFAYKKHFIRHHIQQPRTNRKIKEIPKQLNYVRGHRNKLKCLFFKLHVIKKKKITV